MRQLARTVCGLAAVALIVYGIVQPIEEDVRWLVAIWLAAPLLLVAARLSLPSPPRGVSRSIQSLSLVVGLGFAMLALQLLRQQFVQADQIYNWVYVDEQTGQSTSNVRPVIQSQRIQRGKIIDRAGSVLVDTVMTNGFANRVYPLADAFDPAAFSNIVGYFSTQYGQSAIESTYADYLSGERDAYNRIRDSMLGRPQVGDDVHLTIDARLQAAVGNILGDRVGSIVVLDPKTGAVLAMVSKPGFDPRGLAYNYATADREAETERVRAYWSALNSDGAGQPLLNRPTQGRYPPGSTYKTVTAVGALLHQRQARPGEIDCPNERVTEQGAPPVVNAVPDLRNLTGEPSNLERVFAYSCNTAFAEYAMRLGPELMIDTAENFDIFRPQDAPELYRRFTDLPTKSSLLFVEPGFLSSQAAVADTGYGQGQLLVTPLQMALIAASIANNGLMMEPYLVERVTRPDGSVVVTQGPRAIRRAMPEAVAAEMRAHMRAGVAYGFGKAAQQVDPNVALVGGKSGTAEHAPGATPHAWFIAIAPVEDPRYAIAVMVESGGEGSGIGAQLAGATLAAAFSLEQ